MKEVLSIIGIVFAAGFGMFALIMGFSGSIDRAYLRSYETRSEFYELRSIQTDTQKSQTSTGIFVFVVGEVSSETEHEQYYLAYVKYEDGFKAEKLPIDQTYINEISAGQKPYLEKKLKDTKIPNIGEVVDSQTESYILNVPEGSVSIEFDFGLEGFIASAA